MGVAFVDAIRSAYELFCLWFRFSTKLDPSNCQ